MKLKLFIIAFGFVLPIHGVFADDSAFSFRAPETVMVGTPSRITLLFDPQGGSINALSGTINIVGPASIRRMSTSSSIIPLWVSNPEYSSTSISYEGIIPGGFDGVYSVADQSLKAGTILSFDIIANNYEPITITSSGVAYQNDGQGTGSTVPNQTVLIKVSGAPDGVSGAVYSWALNPIFACGIIPLLWFLRISFKKRRL